MVLSLNVKNNERKLTMGDINENGLVDAIPTRLACCILDSQGLTCRRDKTGPYHSAEATDELNRRRQSAIAMRENASGEIKNPLLGIPKAQLLAQVEAFATKYDMHEQLPLLRKGALIAQNPIDFENLAELDDADRDIIRTEATHRWKHPWAMYFTIILNSIAAAIQGWDQTGSNVRSSRWPTGWWTSC